MASRTFPQHIGSRPCLPTPAARAAESFWPAELKQIRPASRLGRKAALQLQQILRIIFHRRKHYRLWSPESSKYPSRSIWLDPAVSLCPSSRLDWARWPAAPVWCTEDDEVGCGAPSAPRSGPGCDAWCVSNGDKCSRPAAWHKPLRVPCRGIAPSADDRALPGVQPHPEPAPAWGGASVDRLAAYGDTT